MRVFSTGFWCLGLLWMGLVGCDKTVLDDLEVYGKAAPAANKQLKHFADTFRKVRHINELTKLRKYLGQHVLPALHDYVQTLNQMKPQHKDLKEAHQILVDANRAWYQALLHFQQHATTDSQRVQLLQPLEAKARQYFLALKKYQRYMTAIYQDLTAK